MSSPCSHRDISKNTPGSTVLKFSTKCNETHYVHCNRKSVYAPFINMRWPRPSNQKRAMAAERSNESSSEQKQKTSVSKDRRYTKLKKEVTGECFCVQLPYFSDRNRSV